MTIRALLLITSFLFSSYVNAENLIIQTSGILQPELSLPDGTYMGVNLDTNELHPLTTGNQLEIGGNASHILIDVASSGLYTLTLNSGYEQLISINVQLVSSTAQSYVLRYNSIHHPGRQTFYINYDPSDTVTPLLVYTDAGLPVLVDVTPRLTGTAKLNWAASTNPDVTAYRVYAKNKSLTQYTMIAEVTANEYDTGHLLQPVGTEKWQYVVLAITSAGVETLFNQVGQNKIAIAASWTQDVVSGVSPLTVNFTDTSVGYPTAWEWDFDNDGVVDSTEQNPTHVFSELGADTVSLKITSAYGEDQEVQIQLINVVTDSDSDSIGDNVDNCLNVANPSQLDTDADGYGNYCDADFTNDGIVNALDLGLFKQAFFTFGNVVHDLNGDGIVNSQDLGLFKQLFFKPPGPSGLMQ